MSSSTSAATRSTTSGLTKVKVEHLTYEWIIQNFEFLPQENGQQLVSPIFCTMDNELKWKLRVYPQGKKTEHAGYVSIYLHLDSHKAEKINIKVNAILTVFPTEIVRKFEYTYKKSKGSGRSKFIQRSKLLESCTSNDAVKIRCEVAIAREIITEPMDTTDNMEQVFDFQQGQLGQAFRPLLKESEMSDVVVIVGTQKFPAHKVFLAARSPVFSAMFKNKETQENLKNEVKIEGMEPAVVEAMLEFFYTDEVTNLEELAYGILEAADKYDVQRLRSLCEMVLYKRLNIENAAEILIHTDLYHSQKLKEHVMKFMADHLSDVVDTKCYKEMEKKYPALVIELVRSVAIRHKLKKKEIGVIKMEHVNFI